MKKAIIITCAAVLLAVATGSVVAVAQTNGLTTTEPEIPQTSVNYEKPTGAEKKKKKRLKDSISKNTQERMDEFLAQNSGVQPGDAEYHKEYTDAEFEAEYDVMREVIEIVKKYGHTDTGLSFEDFSDRGRYYDFLVECCDTYNDNSYNLDIDERVRIKWMLENAYYGLGEEYASPYITDYNAVKPKLEAAKAAIEETITPEFGTYELTK